MQAACPGGAAREDGEVSRVVPRAAPAPARERLVPAQRTSSSAHLEQSGSIISVDIAVLSMPVITPMPMIGVRAVGVATNPRRQRAARGLAEAIRTGRRVWAVVWQALRVGSGCREDERRQCQSEFSHRSISMWRRRKTTPESKWEKV